MSAIAPTLAMVEKCSDKSFQNVCNAVPFSLALVGSDYRYIVTNKHYAASFFMQPKDLFGKSMEEIVGKSVFESISKPNFDRAIKGEICNLQVWVNQPSKGNCYLDYYYAPYLDEHGEIAGVIISVKDISDLKKQEMLLGRYEQIVNTVSDIMVCVNSDYRYEAVNRRFLEVFGYTWDEVVGKKQIDIVGEENFNRISKPCVDRALLGETVHIKAWSFQKTVGERYMKFCYAPCYGMNGDVNGVIVTSQDHTETIQAETDIDLYNAIMNASADYLTIIDRDHRYLMVNQKYADAFNMNKKVLIGMHLSDVVGEKGYNEISIPNIGECIRNGKKKVTCWVEHPNGGKRCLDMEYTAHKGASGDIVSILVAGHDITDLYESRERLETRENSLTKAQKIAGLGTWDWDIESGQLIVSNETIKIMSNNYYDTKWFSKFSNLNSLFHPDDKQKIKEAIDHCMVSGETYNLEHRIIWPDGTVRWTLVQANLEYREDKPKRVVGITMDITKRKEAEEEIRMLNEQLEERVRERTTQLVEANSTLNLSIQQLKDTQNQLIQSEKMASLGNLVAGVAHEINTPVGMCVSTASFLDDKLRKWEKLFQQDNFSREDFEELLKTSSESMGIMMSNLMRAADLIRSFKQVAVDQSSQKMRTIFMHQYLEEIIKSLTPEFKHKMHSIELKCPQELQLHTNPGAISQIVTNLLINSLIHGFDQMHGGKININVSIEDSMAKLVYTDNGKGIAKENIDKIFEPFFTTRRGNGGSGLGMHIVFNLVNQTLKGDIQCKSKSGAGVVFTIRFPVSTAVEALPSAVAVEQEIAARSA